MGEFEQLIAESTAEAEKEFRGKALFGSEDGIRKVSDKLKEEVADEVRRDREDNERKLEATLSGLTDVSLAAITAFAVDKSTDLTCDWWSGLCRDLSNDLQFGYVAVGLYIAFAVNNVQRKRGQLETAVAVSELGKSIVKRVKSIASPAE